jgi:OTU domain-containing protein 3
MENVVIQSLPFLADPETIRRTLEECKGSIDNAVSKLLDAEERSSVTSTTDSSSSKRQMESDDDYEDESSQSRKRRDRRQSSATTIASRHARKEAIRAANLADEGSVKVDDSDIELPLAIPIDSKVTFMPTGDPSSPTKLHSNRPDYLSLNSSTQQSSNSEPDLSSQPQPVRLLPYHGANVRDSARVRKEKKKLAQKAAARERKLLAAAMSNTGTKSKQSKWNEATAKAVATPSDPPRLGSNLEFGIKTLYI